MAQTVAVVRASLTATNGATTDFTKTGFGTPTAAIIIFDNSNGTNNPQTSSLLGVGFWDATDQRAISAGATDNQGTSATYRSSDDSYGLVMAADGSNKAAYTVSNITDGIRLTMSVDAISDSHFCTVMLFSGISAKTGTFTPNATQNSTQASASLGFAPKLIFFSTIGNTAADTAGGATCIVSFGFAAESGPTHRNLIHALSDAQGAELANVHFSTTRCVGQSSGDAQQWAGEVTTFGADTFTMTTRDGGTGSDVCFFLALGGADISYDTGTMTSRTATGDDVNATDITPGAILTAFSTAASTTLQTAASGANSLQFGMGDADGQFSHNMSSQDAADTTDNNSRSTANKLISLDTSTGSGATLFIEGTVTLNASDFTVNYTTVNATARLGWWVVFANSGAAATTVARLVNGGLVHGGTLMSGRLVREAA